MGLFKSKDEKMAEQLQENIFKELTKTKNLVEDFAVECCDGVATLSGTCDTPKTKKKAILFAEMAEGVTDVQSGGLRISDQYVEPSAETGPPAAAPEKADSAPHAVSPEPAETPAQAEPEIRTVQPEEPAPKSQVYTIQSGDSLSKIAKQFYGNANEYMVIFEANRDILKDPDKIYPGQEIRIPPM